MISTYSLVECGEIDTRVVFALQITPANAGHFVSELGLFLELWESRVGQKNVFITKHRPNTAGHLSVSSVMSARVDPGTCMYFGKFIETD